MISWIWSLFKFIFELLLLAAFLHSFTTHFMVWLEMRYKQVQDEPNIHIPWYSLLKNLFIEAACTLFYFLMIPFANVIGNSTTTSSNVKTPPILLIHGFLHNRTDWLWFRHHLQSIDGVGSIFTINLLPNTKSIAQHAVDVEKKIQKIKNITGVDKIILIGHSRGGLVASYYTEHLAPAETVMSVVSIGTPFSGTKLSAFGLSENVKEMTPNAPILAQLKENIQHSKVPYYQIASKLDNMIIPWHSACPWQFRTSQNTLVLEHTGHLGLLLSPRVISQVVEWIFKENY